MFKLLPFWPISSLLPSQTCSLKQLWRTRPGEITSHYRGSPASLWRHDPIGRIISAEKNWVKFGIDLYLKSDCLLYVPCDEYEKQIAEKMNEPSFKTNMREIWNNIFDTYSQRNWPVNQMPEYIHQEESYTTTRSVQLFVEKTLQSHPWHCSWGHSSNQWTNATRKSKL